MAIKTRAQSAVASDEQDIKPTTTTTTAPNQGRQKKKSKKEKAPRFLEVVHLKDPPRQDPPHDQTPPNEIQEQQEEAVVQFETQEIFRPGDTWESQQEIEHNDEEKKGETEQESEDDKKQHAAEQHVEQVELVEVDADATQMADELLENESPSLNDEVLEIMSDLLEYKIELTFEDAMHRLQHFRTAQHFWNLHPMNKYHFGRLYTQFRLAKCLVDSCNRPPCERVDNVEGDDLHSKSLMMWSRKNWTDFEQALSETRRYCLRDDVKHRLSFNLDEDEMKMLEKPYEQHQENLSSNLFKRDFKQIKASIALHKGLAPIRSRLEDAIYKTEAQEITVDELADVRSFLMDNCVNGKDAVDGICQADSDQPTLLGMKELTRTFRKRPFSLKKFQEDLQFLLLGWKLTLSAEVPILFKLNYRLDNGLEPWHTSRQPDSRAPKRGARDGKARAFRGNLKPPPQSSVAMAPRSRKATAVIDLAESPDSRVARAPKPSDLGADSDSSDSKHNQRSSRKREHSANLPDQADGGDRKPAAKAKRNRSDEDSDDSDCEVHKKRRARGDKLYEKKKSARRIPFEEDLERDDEDDDQRGRVRLGATPIKNSPVPKTYVGPMPDEGVFDENGKVSKRRAWTAEEKTAVKAGVKRYGLGKWVEIKNDYGYILRNRTAVQIKDCWRTMTKKNEASLDDISEDSEVEDDDDDTTEQHEV